MGRQPRWYRVTRDVSGDDPRNYSNRDVDEGEILFECVLATYGCVDTYKGVALTDSPAGGYPFFEFPRDAVEEV
jgi:hypothetical protein